MSMGAPQILMLTLVACQIGVALTCPEPWKARIALAAIFACPLLMLWFGGFFR